MHPVAGATARPLAERPTGAVACLTDESASKRAEIGPPARVPASVAATLARLIDRATPATVATARRCAPRSPLLLTRFDYPTGPVDVVDSTGCSGGPVAYIRDRGYRLPPLLAGYLEELSLFSTTGLEPNLVGQQVIRAAGTARRAGDSLGIDGELLDGAPAGTVLLQGPTDGHQIDVIAAVHRSPPCRTRQLAASFLLSEGSDIPSGEILLRNTSRAWCELDGPAAITGSTAGHPVTRTTTVAVTGDLELSPDSSPPRPGHPVSPDQLTAIVDLFGAPDAGGGPQCRGHLVTPASWQLTVHTATGTARNTPEPGDGQRLGAGGLSVCHGAFAANALHIAVS